MLVVGERHPFVTKAGGERGRGWVDFYVDEGTVADADEHLTQPAVARHDAMGRQGVEHLVAEADPGHRFAGASSLDE